MDNCERRYNARLKVEILVKSSTQNVVVWCLEIVWDLVCLDTAWGLVFIDTVLTLSH